MHLAALLEWARAGDFPGRPGPNRPKRGGACVTFFLLRLPGQTILMRVEPGMRRNAANISLSTLLAHSVALAKPMLLLSDAKFAFMIF